MKKILYPICLISILLCPQFASADDDINALHNLALAGNVTEIDKLLNRGELVDTLDEEGWTPLMKAAIVGETETVDYLIKAGANINATDPESGQSAIHYAAAFAHEDVIQLLLDNGAKVDTKDAIAWTPLMHAAFNDHAYIITYLVDHGADINYINADGITALVIVSQLGYKDALKAILSQNATINNKDEMGWTPLFWAVESQSIESVELLLEYGADAYALDKNGESALNLAEKLLSRAVETLLIDHISTLSLADAEPSRDNLPKVFKKKKPIILREDSDIF